MAKTVQKKSAGRTRQEAGEDGKPKSPVFLTILLAVIGSCGALIFNQFSTYFQAESPAFEPLNSYLNPKDTLFFEPGNASAKKIKSDITFSLDGLKVSSGARLIFKSGKPLWAIHLVSHTLPDSLTHSGKHWLRFHPPDSRNSDSILIALDENAPSGQVQISPSPGNPDEKIIKGFAVDNVQSKNESLRVEIVLQSDDYSNPIPISTQKKYDSKKKMHYFEFETSISGLPRFSPKDKRSAEPFFAYKVRDQAGNEYVHRMSYAQFMAPGENSFGVKDIANINFLKLADDKGISGLKFTIRPARKMITELPNGKPAIHLSVERNDRNVKQLEWSSTLPELKDASNPSIVLRDEKTIAVTLENRFQDDKSPDLPTAQYRVQKFDAKGNLYGSSSTTPRYNPNRLKDSDSSKGPPPLSKIKEELKAGLFRSYLDSGFALKLLDVMYAAESSTREKEHLRTLESLYASDTTALILMRRLQNEILKNRRGIPKDSGSVANQPSQPSEKKKKWWNPWD